MLFFSRYLNSWISEVIAPALMKAAEIRNSSHFRSSSLIELDTFDPSLFDNSFGLKSMLESKCSSMNAVLAPFKISSVFMSIHFQGV